VVLPGWGTTIVYALVPETKSMPEKFQFLRGHGPDLGQQVQNKYTLDFPFSFLVRLLAHVNLGICVTG
jgi:hypothetical protein